MSKTTRIVNVRVVVEPRPMTDFGSVSFGRRLLYDNDQMYWKDMQDRAEEIARDVKRHVDNVRTVNVEVETEAVCEHCGYGWTEGGSPHNGGCCDKDCQVMEAAERGEGV